MTKSKTMLGLGIVLAAAAMSASALDCNWVGAPYAGNLKVVANDSNARVWSYTSKITDYNTPFGYRLAGWMERPIAAGGIDSPTAVTLPSGSQALVQDASAAWVQNLDTEEWIAMPCCDPNLGQCGY
jgi:hypothetical protein